LKQSGYADRLLSVSDGDGDGDDAGDQRTAPAWRIAAV